MKKYESTGDICIKGQFGLTYKVCNLTYLLREDEKFKFIFEPNYSVIELIDSKYFQGIPGLNLDLKEDVYIREDKTPTFISERVPSKNREDYSSLLKKVNLEYMDPIEYLIRTKEQYSGDLLFVLPHKEKEIALFEDINKYNTNTAYIKFILEHICKGNDLIVNGQTINDNNRKSFHDVFIELYSRTQEAKKSIQREGIAKAKELGKYQGRKPIVVDPLVFADAVERVNNKEISPYEAAKELGISIDKYYREKKKLQN